MSPNFYIHVFIPFLPNKELYNCFPSLLADARFIGAVHRIGETFFHVSLL